jgi:hypothetical protein
LNRFCAGIGPGKSQSRRHAENRQIARRE